MRHKHPVNLQLTLNECHGDTHKLINKFFKKFKKQQIIKEYVEKVSFYETRSQKKRRKRRDNEFLRKKEEKERQALEQRYSKRR